MASLQQQAQNPGVCSSLFVFFLTRYENHKMNVWDSSYLLHVDIGFTHLFLLYEHTATNSNEALDCLYKDQNYFALKFMKCFKS